MEPTRNRILRYLEENPDARVREISQSLYLTKANIRHHLCNLLEDGRVEIGLSNYHSQGRGRPANLYRISSTKVATPLIRLTAALLSNTLRNVAGEKARNEIMERVAKSLITNFPVPTLRLSIRLNQVINTLSTLGYKAQWEAHKTSPVISLGFCPYKDLVEDFPEICNIDRLLLENLSGNQVRMINQTRSPSNQTGRCIFEVNSRVKAGQRID